MNNGSQLAVQYTDNGDRLPSQARLLTNTAVLRPLSHWKVSFES